MALLSHFIGSRVLTFIFKGANIYTEPKVSVMHTHKAHFLFMIEITTGVIFLVSTLYGGSNAEASTTVSVDNKSDNSVSTTTATTTSSLIKTPAEMEAYLKSEYADTPILVDIARCESSFKQFRDDGKVVRGKIDRDDIGVMQINERYHGDTAEKLGMDIHTTEGNIAYAKYLYDKFGSQPWSASSKCWSKPVGDHLAVR